MSFSPSSSRGGIGYEDREPAPVELRKQAPPWVVSLTVHLLVLVSCLFISRPVAEVTKAMITTTMEDVEESSERFDSTFVDSVGKDGGDITALATSNSVAANHVAPQDAQEHLKEKVNEVIKPYDGPSAEVVTVGNGELGVKVDTVAGTETTTGTEGSLDRLTLEIASTLKENKALVVWMFDASQSMKERRNTIADRFEIVYKQLGQLNANPDKALKTAIMSFGEKTTFVTEEPVDDVAELAKKIREIKDDESGKENTFATVMAAANKYLPFRQKMHRTVLFIIVTDERGDDYKDLEKNIQFLRRTGIKVYCVGNAAIFGREKGFVTFKDSEGTVWNDLPVDQGPESAYPERVEMPFFGVQARDLDYMSASYGPYALTRLCSETGGMYLINDESRLKFDPIVMKNYRPDYRPIRDYEADLKKNKAKAALVETAIAATMKNAPVPQLVFRADTDNALRQEATEAQRLAAEQDFKVQEIVAMLERGEKDREKLDTPRWRVSYDLAMGRALSMRARYFGYNKMVAEMKVNPKTFEGKGNNQWTMTPSREITSGPDVKKLEKRALEYLNRVIDEHPGTPWAMLAERELSQPMGWAWKEGKADYAGMDRQAQERRALQLAEEENEKKTGKKKEMPKPKPQPKL